MGISSICERLDSCGNFPGRRWVLIIAGLIECFFFGGFHYGYNALIEPYKKIGVFRDLCNETHSECKERDLMFNNASIAWVVCQMCLITGAGLIMDRFGLRLLKLIAIGLYFIGTLMFAFTLEQTGYILFPAGIFVALGSTSMLICDHQISSKFPRFRGFAISLLSGAFDSSTVMTFIIAKTSGTISVQTSFIILGVCALVYGVCMALFGLTQWSAGMSLVEETTDTKDGKDEDTEYNTSDEVDPDARIQEIIESRYYSLKKCLGSIPFFLVTLWFMFGLLSFQLFLNRMATLLDFRFGNNQALIDELSPVSSALLMAGLAFAPLSGFIMDSSRSLMHSIIKKKMEAEHEKPVSDGQLYRLHLCGLAPAFFIGAISATIACGLNMNKSVGAYYASFVFLVIMRSLLFSASVSFVLIAFPIEHFGAVNGILNTIAGIFGLIQYGLIILSAEAGNVVALAITVVLYISPLYMTISALVKE